MKLGIKADSNRNTSEQVAWPKGTRAPSGEQKKHEEK